MSKYAGADWLRENLKHCPEASGKELSPLAVKVADILGQVYRGLYHLPNVERQEWFNPHFVRVGIGSRELATYDGFELSHLVVLCHDAAIRLSVSAEIEPWETDGENGEEVKALREDVKAHSVDPNNMVGSPVLVLRFHQRDHGDGLAIWHRHPTMEEAIQLARGKP